jgi:hypothetical protein
MELKLVGLDMGTMLLNDLKVLKILKILKILKKHILSRFAQIALKRSDTILYEYDWKGCRGCHGYRGCGTSILITSSSS